MKLCATKAAVMLGWYLLLPVIRYEPNHDRLVLCCWNDAQAHSPSNIPVSSIPDLAMWEHAGSFDTASECEAARSSLDPEATAQLKTTKAQPQLATWLKRHRA